MFCVCKANKWFHSIFCYLTFFVDLFCGILFLNNIPLLIEKVIISINLLWTLNILRFEFRFLIWVNVIILVKIDVFTSTCSDMNRLIYLIFLIFFLFHLNEKRSAVWMFFIVWIYAFLWEIGFHDVSPYWHSTLSIVLIPC